jgi:hypothetical protein
VNVRGSFACLDAGCEKKVSLRPRATARDPYTSEPAGALRVLRFARRWS